MKKVLLSISLLGSFALANSIEINHLKWTEDFETLVNLSSNVENTIEGLDENNNGVRDDVEYYVNTKYKNKPFQKEMFIKAAKTMQKIITLPANDRLQEHQYLDHKLLNLYTCRDYILYRMEDDALEQEMLDKISFKGKVLNTQKRLQAYIEHKKLLPYEFDELTDTELKREKQICINYYNKYKGKETQTLTNARL